MSDEQHNEPSGQSQTAIYSPRRTGLTFLRWGLNQVKELLAAIRFLSTLPLPGSAQLFHTEQAEPQLIIGSAYFSLVGLLIGAILCLIPLLVATYFPPLVLAALLVVAQIVLSGGLHLDGLMDACDGLFGGTGREHKLEIMRDSRVGSFGVLGGASILLLKFALFASLDIHHLLLAFLLVLPVGRWTMVLCMRVFPSARPTGLGAAVRQTVTLLRFCLAGLFALGIALAVGQLAGLAIWLTGTVTALALGAWATNRLGGLTGDLYGGGAEVVEVVCLLLLSLLATIKV